MSRRIPPPHPGQVLRQEFLETMGLSVYALAKAIGVPRSRINANCNGEQRVTAAVALRLGKFFDVDPRWFMNMQTQYDLHIESARLADKTAAIAPRRVRLSPSPACGRRWPRSGRMRGRD